MRPRVFVRSVMNGFEEYCLAARRSTHVIVEDDAPAALKKCFALACALYKAWDPYQCYDRLFYNTPLTGLEYKTLLPSLPSRGSDTMPMRSLKGTR
jgi:hypothetical protein